MFRVLPGLPPYGPPAKPFGSDQGRYREGFVVEFQDENATWIGNFIGGGTDFDRVLEHPDGRSAIVIASGLGFTIDPHAREATSMFGGLITGVVYSGRDRIVFSTFTEFEAHGPAGREWRTRQLSGDGFRFLRIEGATLRGEAWSPSPDTWREFSVELATGEATGGAYP